MDALLCTASDGVRCAARVAGRAGEPLLFVHDAGSTAAIWDPQLRALSERFRCAAVELRGNGVTPLPANLSAITREGFARDCLAVADTLGFTRWHLVGCGLGGLVGLELFRCAQERLASLALLDSFAAYPDGEGMAARIVEQALTATSFISFAEQRASELLPLGAPAHRRTDYVRQLASHDRRAYARFAHATWTGDYRPLLAHINVPTLVLWGERDVLVPRRLCEGLAAWIAGARLLVVPDAGHISNADAPAFVNAALEAFFLSVSDQLPPKDAPPSDRTPQYDDHGCRRRSR